MGSDTLAQVLRPLTSTFAAQQNDALLVGLGAADDAAVYRIRYDQAIVATVDFFPPVVDDPATYGAIAVTNALSDIYAMGARPLLALNIVAFPDDLDPAILTEILRGGAEQARRAGVVIAGGHTVMDQEPKYGLAVIGMVHPELIITKGGAQPGDVIILTKPIGTGIITTALKRDAIDETSAAYQAAVVSMTTLNAVAMETITSTARSHAGTDITGFGLLGHLWEMLSAGATPLGARITAAAVPLLPGARDLAMAGIAPGGTERNLAAITPHVRWGAAITDVERALLADPQTAGGLAVAVAAEDAPGLLAALTAAGGSAWPVATVTDSGMIEVE
jgi:selenide, water dikinase